MHAVLVSMLSLSVLLLGSGASAIEHDTVTKVIRAQNPRRQKKPRRQLGRPTTPPRCS